MIEVSRRKLLNGLAITIPAVWIKPTVKSVVLPAHANTSLAITCVASPAAGSTVPIDQEIDVIVSISPNPGPGQFLSIQGFCDGQEVFSDSGPIGINGQFVSVGTLEFCEVGQEGCVRYSFRSASEECCWTATDPIGN